MLVLTHQYSQCCEAGASPLGWPGGSKLWICTTNPASHMFSEQPSISGKTMAPSCCFFSTFCGSSCIIVPHHESAVRFLKLAPWNRKCRFPHVWNRWVVHKRWYRRTRFAFCYMKQPSPMYSDLSFNKWTGTGQGRWRWGKWAGLSSQDPCFHSMPEGDEWKNIFQPRKEQLVQKVLVY